MPQSKINCLLRNILNTFSLLQCFAALFSIVHLLTTWSGDLSFCRCAELLSFENRLDEFLIIDCAFVGVSCDTEMVHLKWTEIPVDQGGDTNTNTNNNANTHILSNSHVVGKLVHDFGLTSLHPDASMR